MIEKLYKACEKIIRNEKETKNFLKLKATDDVYTYFSKQIPELTREKFYNFMRVLLQKYPESLSHCETLDGKSLAAIAGGANLNQKIASGALSLLSLLPNAYAVNSANPENSNMPTNIEKKEENIQSKSQIKKHPYLFGGSCAAIIIAALTYAHHKGSNREYEFIQEQELMQIKNKVLEDISKGDYTSINNKSPKHEYTALMAAAYFGDLENLKLLLAHGADIGAHAYIPWPTTKHGPSVALDFAFECKNNDPELKVAMIKQLLLQHNPNSIWYSRYKTDILREAVCQYGDAVLLKKLLENITYEPEHLTWFLGCPDKNLHAELVDVLINAGAFVNPPEAYVLSELSGGALTPLHTNAKDGFFENVEALLDHGANVNALTEKQDTPLILAANEEGYRFFKSETNALRTVQCLLKHGADINITNKNNHSALHVAIASRYVSVTDTLLNEPTLTAATKNSALEYAKKLHGQEPSDKKLNEVLKLFDKS